MSGPRLRVRLSHRRGDFTLDAALDVESETVAVVGPNGCGKSTLLLALLGLRRPTLGTIRLDDSLLFDSQQRIDQPPEQRRLSYLPQDFGLFPFLTARQNVAFPTASHVGGSGPASGRTDVQELLEHFGIAHLSERLPAQLSGGERQRVALARSLAMRPRAVLLDEPTASLDVAARAEVRALLAAELRILGVPALVVTHDLEDVNALASRVAVMQNGCIVACAPVDQFRRSPPTEFARRLLGGERSPALARGGR